MTQFSEFEEAVSHMKFRDCLPWEFEWSLMDDARKAAARAANIASFTVRTVTFERTIYVIRVR